METFDGLLRETMIVAAVLCIPVLSVAAIVGACVAIAQAATQVQEQTLSALPKLLAVAAVAALGGGFGLHLCAKLFADAIAAIPMLLQA